MKKKDVYGGLSILVVVFSLFFLSNFVSAANCTSFTYSEWGACSSGIQTRTVVNSTPVNCTGGNSVLTQNCTSSTTTQNKTNEEKAFECLVTNLKSDCSGATDVQQLAFSILASPNITGRCVEQLLKKEKTEGCFGNTNCGVKETAWAILALNHVGKDSSKAVEWLMKQNKTSSDVEWFLQQDSVGDVSCKLTYDSSDYSLNAAENKKLSGNVGPCFSFAQSSYWLRLNENCFDKEFVLTCNKEFFAGWHYKSLGSQVLNVLSETAKRTANDPVTLKVNSRCFGSSSGCNFEETAWAVFALKKVGKDIKPYVPYLISAEESNLMYFPAALNYLVLDFSTLYGNKVVQQQKENQFWEAENSVYGSVYDTALALFTFPLTSSQEQVKNAKSWLMNLKQNANGCWNSNNIRDTAFVLWALTQKQAPADPVIASTTRCEQGGTGFTCSSSLNCVGAGGSSMPNYFCGGSQICCNINPVKSCSELLGTVCSSGLVCSGREEVSTTGACCLGECAERTTSTDECTNAGLVCKSRCSSSESEVDYSCSDSSRVCCEAEYSSEEGGVPMWVWFLLGILAILVVLAVLFRDRIKVWFHKRKIGNGSVGGQPRPPFNGPPRPGFPPMNRPMGRPMMPPPGMQRPQMQNDTFAKLKEMTK